MENNPKIKYAFFGTPELTVTILDYLKENNYLPEVIITMPDRPMGRKMQITPPPAKIWGMENNIPVLQPEKLNTEFLDKLRAFDFELSVVVAYGKIIPENVITLPKFGTVNIHYSLLPKYRGATPVESAILAGDNETGVCIQQMKYELDSGPILAQEIVKINENETAEELLNKLNETAKVMLVDLLPEILENKLEPKEQDHTEASFCKKIKKEDGELLESDSDEIRWRKYRAYFGWPGVFFFKDGKRIKITKAHYENGQFVIERIIPEGKKEMDFNILK